MGVFTLLDSGTRVVAGIHDLAGEALFHGLLTSCTTIVSQPAQTKGLTSFGPNFNRNLIVRTADTAGLDFHGRHDVFHGGLESLETRLAGLLFHDLERTVDDLLGYALLAVEHDAVDELGHQNGTVDRIGKDLSLGNITSSGHCASLLHKMIS